MKLAYGMMVVFSLQMAGCSEAAEDQQATLKAASDEKKPGKPKEGLQDKQESRLAHLQGLIQSHHEAWGEAEFWREVTIRSLAERDVQSNMIANEEMIRNAQRLILHQKALVESREPCALAYLRSFQSSNPSLRRHYTSATLRTLHSRINAALIDSIKKLQTSVKDADPELKIVERDQAEAHLRSVLKDSAGEFSVELKTEALHIQSASLPGAESGNTSWHFIVNKRHTIMVRKFGGACFIRKGSKRIPLFKQPEASAARPEAADDKAAQRKSELVLRTRVAYQIRNEIEKAIGVYIRHHHQHRSRLISDRMFLQGSSHGLPFDLNAVHIRVLKVAAQYLRASGLEDMHKAYPRAGKYFQTLRPH